MQRTERDSDDTDFRGVAESYKHRESGCLFCELPTDRLVLENRLAVAILDKFPVTERHMLVIPRRHAQTYFDLGRPEVNACNLLMGEAKARIEMDDPSVTGFNVGFNAGVAGGPDVLPLPRPPHPTPRRRRARAGGRGPSPDPGEGLLRA